MSTDPNQQPAASAATAAGPGRRLPRLQWEKLVIWALFLYAIYILRHFFFVIFMTFIVSYIMRRVIVRAMRGRREAPALERVLTVLCFALLGLGLYTALRYLGPPLKAQYDALLGRVIRLDPRREFESLGARTVGAYLFDRTYGDRGDERYDAEFGRYAEEVGRPLHLTAFQEFGNLDDEIEGMFEQRIRDRIEAAETSPGTTFEDWFLTRRAPRLFAARRDQLVADFEARYSLLLEARRGEPDYEQWRDGLIRRQLLEQIKQAERAGLEDQWRTELRADVVAALRRAPGFTDELREHYHSMKTANPGRYRYSFEEYQELKLAHGRGEEAFAEALSIRHDMSEEEQAAQRHRDFVLGKQQQLFRGWWRDDPLASELKDRLTDYAGAYAARIGTQITEAVKFLITLPLQLSLSLLLSLFITFDIPTLRKGVRRLRDSRLSGVYEEIAPGLINFGHLMGRAFQAQGIIAFFNTVLTFAAIRFLGIENEAFLCSVVFVCSFIPVLGVVLSSIPIALMAILQPDGSLTLALYAVLAIILIHFIEASLLNPKILGDMLHLHPVLVLAVLAIGEEFFGAWGLLLAVPVAVYVIRFVVFQEGIPGLTEPPRRGSEASV